MTVQLTSLYNIDRRDTLLAFLRNLSSNGWILNYLHAKPFADMAKKS